MPIRGIGGHNILGALCRWRARRIQRNNMEISGDYPPYARRKSRFSGQRSNELLEVLKQLLDDASLREVSVKNGRALIQRNLGATAQTLSLIKPFLNAGIKNNNSACF